MPTVPSDNQLRVCYRGTLTHDEAQEKIGAAFRVLELRPATCPGDGDDLVSGTEIIFAPLNGPARG